jgi:DtxR family Mn-dependent transcriptional regulator
MAAQECSATEKFSLPPKAAESQEHLMLRHQLPEMLLTGVIGLPWAKSHAAAERLEHAISPEIEALLKKRFAGHKTCPHGVPLNGGVSQLRGQGGVLLSELQPGDSAVVLCVDEKEEGFLDFLEDLQLLPSSKLQVLKCGHDETRTLRVAGHTIHLGKTATSRMWVRRGN